MFGLKGIRKSRESSAKQSLREKKELASSLQVQADAMISAGLHESAITILSTALMLDPSCLPVIHKIGACLEQAGYEDDAQSCYRGSIPDSVNEKYFGSAELSKRLKSVSGCTEVSYHSGFKEERIKLTKPSRNTTDKKYNQFNYKETFARESFCTIATDGLIWFDRFNVLALDRNRSIIEPHTKGNDFACYHAVQSSQPRHLKGTACFLDGRSSSIYYHWMLDILPKLGVMEAAGISLDEIDYYIVSATSRFQLNTLRKCGVRDEQLIFAADTSLYQADRMIVPSLKNDQGDRIYHGLGVGLSSQVIDFLRHKFIPAKSANSSPVKLYISRSTRGSRNIANEPELIAALQTHGFETVEFEHLTVTEQADLMSRAEVVIGVHGAGFTNLSFCKPGTQVIEIFGDYVVPCYWALSAVANLRYVQFMGRGVDKSSDADNPYDRLNQLRDMEIEIDVDEFIKYLEVTNGITTAAA